MKKLVALLVAVFLISSSASAVTVSEFAKRYNDDIRKGFPVSLYEQFILDGKVWALSGYDERNVVLVTFDPSSAADPRDCQITSVALKHKPRVSVGVFLNNICAALAAAFPDVPEQERLAEAMQCLRTGDQVLGTGYFQKDPVPYNTQHMGQFVYQEETDYHTFLFSLEPAPSAEPAAEETASAEPASEEAPAQLLRLPPGEYIVGEDVPAGRYQASVPSDTYIATFEVRKDESDTFGKTYWLGTVYGNTVANITLRDGNILQINTITLTLEPKGETNADR